MVEPHSRSMVPFAINGCGCRGDGLSRVLIWASLSSVLHPVDDAGAEVPWAHDLLAVVVIENGREDLAVAERDGAGVLDLLKRAGEILGERRAGEEARRGDRRKQNPETRGFSAVN